MTPSLKLPFAAGVAAVFAVAALVCLMVGFALASLPLALVSAVLGVCGLILAIETRINEVIVSSRHSPRLRGLRWRLRLAAELIALGSGPHTRLRFLDDVIVDLHCSFKD
jgi:cytochrome c oxidase assembly protein Cox11